MERSNERAKLRCKRDVRAMTLRAAVKIRHDDTRKFQSFRLVDRHQTNHIGCQRVCAGRRFFRHPDNELAQLCYKSMQAEQTISIGCTSVALKFSE